MSLWVSFRCPEVPFRLYIKASPFTTGRDTLTNKKKAITLKVAWLRLWHGRWLTPCQVI